MPRHNNHRNSVARPIKMSGTGGRLVLPPLELEAPEVAARALEGLDEDDSHSSLSKQVAFRAIKLWGSVDTVTAAMKWEGANDTGVDRMTSVYMPDSSGVLQFALMKTDGFMQGNEKVDMTRLISPEWQAAASLATQRLVSVFEEPTDLVTYDGNRIGKAADRARTDSLRASGYRY